MHIPIVIEQSGDNQERAYDIYSRLLKDNIVFVGDVIDDDMANAVIGQLLFLSEESESDIKMYINSAGGSVTAGLAIVDTMDFIKPDIATYCIGQASSMAAIILAKGTKGKRYSLPHSRIMIHQPSISHLSGSSTDIQIYAKELEEMKTMLAEILTESTGQDFKKVKDDMERDFFMRPQAAKEYGIIDSIKALKKKLPKVD